MMRNFGQTTNTTTNVSNVPANANVNTNANVEEEKSTFEEYFPTVYKAIWGKDVEEQLITKETRLQYLLKGVEVAPGTKPYVQTEITRLEREIASLKAKVFAAKVRRVVLIVIPTGIGASMIYYLIKRANK